MADPPIPSVRSPPTTTTAGGGVASSQVPPGYRIVKVRKPDGTIVRVRRLIASSLDGTLPATPASPTIGLEPLLSTAEDTVSAAPNKDAPTPVANAAPAPHTADSTRTNPAVNSVNQSAVRDPNGNGPTKAAPMPVRKDKNTIVNIVDEKPREPANLTKSGRIKAALARLVFADRLQGTFMSYWWQELIILLIMLAALAAIILILALRHDRPLPDWPSSITLNSLISVMVVIMKAAMLAILASGLGQTKWLWFEKTRPMSHYALYDKAGQGPSYAILLLWVLRGKQFFATLALFAIVVATALDPFTQQVIQYYIISTPISGLNATLPASSSYNATGYHSGGSSFTMNSPMQGAIIASFYTPGSDRVSVSNCATGNCTFSQPYQTIAMCSACSDIGNLVDGTCGSIAGIAQAHACNYTLPSRLNLTSETLEKPNSDVFIAGLSSYQSSLTIPSGAVFTREFMAVPYLNNSQDSEITINYSNSSCQGSACNVTAAICYLYPCIRSYIAEVRSGILAETLVSSIPVYYTNPSLTPDSDQLCWANLKKSCLTSKDWSILETIGLTPNNYSSVDYIPFCNTNQQTLAPKLTESCLFQFSAATFLSWNDFFQSAFNPFLNGSLTADIVPGDPGIGGSPLAARGPPDLGFLYFNTASPKLGEFVTVSSINATFMSIADAMTTRMRLDGVGGYYTPALGVINQTQTLVGVQWAWLALPVSLVLITLIFIIIVMIFTSMNGRHPIGKTFSLGVLLTGVAGQVADQFTETKHLHSAARKIGVAKRTYSKNITKEMEETQIRLMRTDDGWRLAKL